MDEHLPACGKTFAFVWDVPQHAVVDRVDAWTAQRLWHERYVEEPADRILERAAAHQPALYVLTGDEIPFVQDGLRDGEHIRHAMQARFRQVLAAHGTRWVEVHGAVPERVSVAGAAISAAVQLPISYQQG